jgi:hypothetical protein
MDRPLRWWVPSIPWEPTVEPTVGQTIFTRPFSPCPDPVADCWPDLFAARSPARPIFRHYRTDLFAGAGQSARPFRGMGQPRRGRQWDRADNGTGLLSVLLPVGRWMDGGRADDRQMARPLRETSSRDRAGGGVGGATDGANRRAWLGLVALRGADLRRRRYRCAGRGERSSRGSGVGRWWR